jgi:hypothetical protein
VLPLATVEDAVPTSRAEVELVRPGLLSPDGVLLFRQRFERGRQDTDDAWLLRVDASLTWRGARGPDEPAQAPPDPGRAGE